MPVEDFSRVLDNIKSSGIKNLTICITGGEPLVRKDLELAGKEIIRHGYNWGIVTNGLMMTKERFTSLIRSGMGSMSVSLDGLKNEHNDLRQNNKSFDTVEKTIKLCVEQNKASPYGFVFDVITCVHSGNINTLPLLRDYLIHNGVTAWRIFQSFQVVVQRKISLLFQKKNIAILWILL
jgi:sulfatase maturation enzyme AslB (radical SAM superfamily)